MPVQRPVDNHNHINQIMERLDKLDEQNQKTYNVLNQKMDLLLKQLLLQDE